MESNQILLGKILGEIYRLQNKSHINISISKERIYGLLHGFESSINDELESIGFISQEQEQQMVSVLEEYSEPEKLAKFTGFSEIEEILTGMAIDRDTARKILIKIYAEGLFHDIINKMDSSGSPPECRTFHLSLY